METATLSMESLDCFHSPAVYHSVHMLEPNGDKNWELCDYDRARGGLCVVPLCVARQAEHAANAAGITGSVPRAVPYSM